MNLFKAFRLPARMSATSHMERLLADDMRVIARWRRRAEMNPARTVCARKFETDLYYQRMAQPRANVAQFRIKKARKQVRA